MCATGSRFRGAQALRRLTFRQHDPELSERRAEEASARESSRPVAHLAPVDRLDQAAFRPG
jgi:hypothetical protein